MKKLLLGKFKGLSKFFDPYNIDNNSFPELLNAYARRGKIYRKRGTAILDRLKRQIVMVDPPVNPWEYAAITLAGGVGNLITDTATDLEVNSRIVPGSINLVLTGGVGGTYTEPATPNGTLLRNGIADPNSSINYSTGAIFLQGGGAGIVTGSFSYYPNLPVMGLEDFDSNLLSDLFPLQIAFDTTYAYQINQTSGTQNYYSISYYKNTNNPVVWSNTDANLFWTTNYQSAFWATNNKPGLHFVDGSYLAGTGTAVVDFTFTSVGSPFQTLIVGDKLWFNEWTTGGSNLNGLVGTVSAIIDAALGKYTVTFLSVVVVAGTGIAQLLTNSIAGQDGIRWYDGDPTTKTGIPTGTNKGWVNFAPPLTANSVSINSQTTGKYYLVGALAIVPFKERLLFFGPQIRTSGGNVIQRPLQDTVLWSWNGTPYYNSFVPTNATSTETFDTTAYYVDENGKGGYLPAGISMPIITVNNNEDVLIVNFGGKGRKTRFAYTGNDLQPFLFYSINAELPSDSTYSSISLDAGVLDIGSFGFAITTQQSAERIDMEFPDEVFRIKADTEGYKRVNAVRDFANEWVYFTYPVNDVTWKYPTRTLLFNYRENSWGELKENFTVQGYFRKQEKESWYTASAKYKIWANWTDSWNLGSNSPEIAQVCGGNPQGYVVIRSEGTGEAYSAEIADITSSSLSMTNIKSINHCVELGDYIYIDRCIGLDYLNGEIAQVTRITDADNFIIDIPFLAGTYLGLGEFQRLSVPIIKTKQFPGYWEAGKKTRIGVQKYLFDYTGSGQATINLYLSTDPDNVYNSGNIVPRIDVLNSSLVYSQLVYTCPESTNLGLTPPNTNLQMPTANGQYAIWHRMNTNLIGDTVQIGITLSDEQMRDLTIATSELVLHGVDIDLYEGPYLA